jgi:RNA-directed DNA polymerase
MEGRATGNWDRAMTDEPNKNPVQVSMLATPTGEADPYGWVERSVWTERMVECLRRGGPEGGKWYSLHDKVFATKTLEAGFAQVLANRGAPGVDGVSVDDFEQRLGEEISYLQRTWRSGTYRPNAVRRVWIPKPGSTEQRPLGIPTVRDRVVQAALGLVIEPIFENDFHPHSYGFRPGRSAQQAAGAVINHLKSQRLVVVDVDLKAFFDSIPHERLLNAVRRRITDGRVLELIGMFLKAGIKEDTGLTTPETGTPQGGVISPLLANIYLDELDHHMAQHGREMIRYADDFVILCEHEDDAKHALNDVQTWTAQAGLTLHPTKTRIVNLHQPGAWFDFLGYRFKRHDHPNGTFRILRLVRDKSLAKARDAIRTLTPRNTGISLTEIIRQTNCWARGWFGYFRSVHRNIHQSLDSMLRRRLRSILSRRKGRERWGRGNAHFLWPNAYFTEHGLFSLEQAHTEFLTSRKGTR